MQGGGPNGYPGVNAGAGPPPPANASCASGGIAGIIPNNPTGVWVGDYTIQPENGGLGVFAHEFGHDLGLPDLYDTSGNTGGAENSTGFWTLMSSGANIGDGGPEGIGDDPTDLGAWEKLQLGWLDYDTAVAGKKSEHKLGPAEFATKSGAGTARRVAGEGSAAQSWGSVRGVRQQVLLLGLGRRPHELDDEVDHGAHRGDAAHRQGAVPDRGGLGLRVPAGVVERRHVVDEHPDEPLAHTDPNGQNLGFGITGSTGVTWVDLTGTLPVGTNAVRFVYVTDAAVVEPGFQVDNIAVGGTVIGSAETDSEGWTFVGFRTTTGSEIELFANYYLAENRQYISYDTSLRTAYNFGFLDTRPDWVEHFRYQNGLLINYWDTSQSDNNVGDHPGKGLILPIDAHPTFHHTYDGHLVRPRILTYDSTFGVEPKEAITIHKDSRPTTIPADRRFRCSTTPRTTGSTATRRAPARTLADTSLAGSG